MLRTIGHASKNEACHAEGCPGLFLSCIFNMAAVQHFYYSTKDFLTISLVQVASAWTAVAVSNYALPGISLISSPAPSCQLFCCVYFVMCFITLRFKSRINFTVWFALLGNFLSCLRKITSYWATLSEWLVSLSKWRYKTFLSPNDLTKKRYALNIFLVTVLSKLKTSSSMGNWIDFKFKCDVYYKFGFLIIHRP